MDRYRDGKPFAALQVIVDVDPKDGTIKTQDTKWNYVDIEVNKTQLCNFKRLDQYQKFFTHTEITNAGYPNFDTLDNHIDATIGELLDWLNEFIGYDNYIIDRGCSRIWFLDEHNLTHFMLRWKQ